MGILDEKRLIRDGGMGTMLQDAGLPAGASPDVWNLENPDGVEAVHRAYLAAGSRLSVSNTFGCNALRQKRGKYPVAELAAAGVAIARRAVERAEHPAYVAMDIGPLGVFLDPIGDLTEEEAVELFRIPVEAGVQAGADCLYVETMCDIGEAAAAIAACKRYGGGLPVLCTMSFMERGRLMTGATAEDVAEGLTEAGADAVGCNCGVGPEQLINLLPEFAAHTKKPLIMCPNAGLPVLRNGEAVYDVTPAQFAERMRALYQGGVWMLGGCCGTTPDHIRALSDMLQGEMKQ